MFKCLLSIAVCIVISISTLYAQEKSSEESLDDILISFKYYTEILSELNTIAEQNEAKRQLVLMLQEKLEEKNVITSLKVSRIDDKSQIPIIYFDKIYLPQFSKVKEQAAFNLISPWKISLPITRKDASNISSGQTIIIKGKASLHDLNNIHQHGTKPPFLKLQYKMPIKGGFAMRFQPIGYSLQNSHKVVEIEKQEPILTKQMSQLPKSSSSNNSESSIFTSFLPIVIIFAIFFIIKKLGLLPSKGETGERKMVQALSSLSDNEYIKLHNITIPDNQGGTTQIDHIVISKYGLFVIETKNYSGWILGNESQRKWTQVHFKQKNQFQNPLRQNYKHTATLNKYLNLPQESIFSIVAFVGGAEFKADNKPNNVFMNTKSVIRHIMSKGITYFSEKNCLNIKDKIETLALENTKEVRQAHINYLKNKHNK